MEGVLYDISGAPNGSVPQNICSYGISGWLARKRKICVQEMQEKGTDQFTENS